MVHLFAKPVPVINMITNEVFTYIYATRRHRIQQLNYQLLRPRNLKYYAFVAHRKEHHWITASGLSTELFGLYLDQNVTKESSTTIANMFGPVSGYFKMFAFQSLCLLTCVCI